MMARHGDLLIREISCLPEGVIKSDYKIILRGEMTDHNHEITKNATLYFVPQGKYGSEISLPSRLIFAFIHATGPTEIIHPEHKTIKLPKGFYEVRRQREVKGLVSD